MSDYYSAEDPFENALMHYGILRKSGRYPWGTGNNPTQRNKSFLDYVDQLAKEGLSETEIARGIGLMDPDGTGKNFGTTQLRALKAIAKNEQRAAAITRAVQLKKAGNSTSAIGRLMDINESSVRALLDPSAKENNDKLTTIANLLRDQLKEKKYLDVGAGVEQQLGISKEKLNTAVAMLEEEGYHNYKVKVPQLTNDNDTTMKVLASPGTPYREVFLNQKDIRTIRNYSEDGGSTFLGIEPPTDVSSKRVGVRYAKEGGAEKDGVIELRRGVPDLSLGGARYAQVRIQVDGTHYLKGMAMYSDDMPDGVDMVFNTNKDPSGNKLDAMKPLKRDKLSGNVDEDNPFGSVVRQKHYIDSNGNKKLSPINIVGTKDPDGVKTPGEEGAWYQWSKNLSSQMLSKQSPVLAKKQLDQAYDIRKAEFDEINALTNPAVKKKLLQSFSDGADAASVKLAAAGLPRTRNHVILPINSLKDTEIYAPQYKNGEKVVLIRHPHGGIFEIPELTVNNRNPDGKRLLQDAIDAVGINARVAEKLSGADFDGDTVLVIPNKQSGPDRVKTAPTLAALKKFDPKVEYKAYEGMPKMRNKQQEMGKISNLITDMTIQDAPFEEIARAVKHSMVVIDAEKHDLNYKQSAINNGISQLKAKYQGKTNGGASTLISLAKSKEPVPKRKPRSAANGGPIDPDTGKKMWDYTDESYVKTKTSKSGVVTASTVKKTMTSKKMLEVDDAFDLSSGTVMEAVYATHANKLKALANEARRVQYHTPPVKQIASAKQTYAPQIKSLTDKLLLAQQNAPAERQALLFAKATLDAKRQADPDMTKEEAKKIKGMALATARARIGAKKENINITPIEWDAIQAGAISNARLNSILDNTDLDVVKALATPREAPVMVPAKIARARAMQANGYTPSEIAEQLGVPVSTLTSAMS